jgi:hypothetical protein
MTGKNADSSPTFAIAQEGDFSAVKLKPNNHPVLYIIKAIHKCKRRVQYG